MLIAEIQGCITLILIVMNSDFCQFIKHAIIKSSCVIGFLSLRNIKDFLLQNIRTIVK